MKKIWAWIVACFASLWARVTGWAKSSAPADDAAKAKGWIATGWSYVTWAGSTVRDGAAFIWALTVVKRTFWLSVGGSWMAACFVAGFGIATDEWKPSATNAIARATALEAKIKTTTVERDTYYGRALAAEKKLAELSPGAAAVTPQASRDLPAPKPLVRRKQAVTSPASLLEFPKALQ